ncbi:Lrp/AsnC family transcriptional regulator [Salinicola lusitanus]|uniref:Lrp/AsnC family transcriptional regulator n=1 Tax=Salinicola lusitanus TaxID=1949085 RepID=A0ABZ3CY63_9GAMM|nr:Lrp/AsnC family transcriptional regulator [Salinicola lusitanus]
MGIKDNVDSQIIELLKKNAREKLSNIARLVNRSRTSVEKRIERLEADGTIQGYNVILNTDKERSSKKLRGFVIINHVYGSQCEQLLKELETFDIIKSKYSVYGDLDLILEISYDSLEEMMKLKYFLTEHPKVKSSSISPVIKMWD